MIPDDASHTDPVTVAAWLIQETPRAKTMTPEERHELQRRVEALITRARGRQAGPRPAPPIREW